MLRTPSALRSHSGHVAVVPRRDWRSGWRRRIAASAVPLAAALIGLATGGYRLGQPPLWRDEAATKAIAGRSVRQILATLPNDDAVHGAYYLVVHLVSGVIGPSAAALRLPSAVAMAVASAFTALIARELVAAAAGPFADLTGLAAGALYAITPSTIGYAQQARSYTIVTMLATIATYLLIQAVKREAEALKREAGPAAQKRWWWPAYGIAIALTGLFNLFGLLLIVAHGLSLLATCQLLDRGAIRRRRPVAAGIWRRWLVATGLAAIALVPLAILAYPQRGALGWMPPHQAWWANFVVFIDSGAGSAGLAIPIALLAIAGVAMETATGITTEVAATRGRLPIGPAAIAVPWLLAPAVLLLSVSQVHPVWDVRYVAFCLPPFAILFAWSLNWLTRIAAATRLRDLRLAWLPLAAGPLIVFAAFAPATAAIRYSRPDNLLAESRIIGRHERPGDIVFYLPVNDRIVSLPFPGAFRNLRDIALAQSPVASDTLYGIDVSPAVLARRFTHVTRVWVITSAGVDYLKTGHVTTLDAEEGRLIAGMRVVGHWRDHDTMLTLWKKSRD